MSILNKLQNDGSPLAIGTGGTPAIPNFKQSKLHDTYSLDGDPNKDGKPEPSILDLGKNTPKYLDNLPQ